MSPRGASYFYFPFDPIFPLPNGRISAPNPQPRSATPQMVSLVLVHTKLHNNGTCMTHGLHQLCLPAGSMQQSSDIATYHMRSYCSSSSTAPLTQGRSLAAKKRKCLHPDCNKWPSFNFEGETRLYCRDHQLPRMVNVEYVNRKGRDQKRGTRYCKHPLCKKVSTHGLQADARHYCANHKQPGMTAIGRKLCQESGCEARATFSPPGTVGPSFCSSHRRPGMVCKHRSICESPGCDVTASFGEVRSRVRRCCVTHKLHSMVLKTRKSDT